MSTDAPWPPRVGGLLPRAGEATGVRRKLEAYSLNTTHRRGGVKARGFERILGITSEDIDYLEGAIHTGVLAVAVCAIRANPPWGIKCVVTVPVRGRSDTRDRVVSVRTVWQLISADTPPRLVNALCKP